MRVIVKKLKSINKKKSMSEVLTYALSIGAGSLVGFLAGGSTWLCIGSLVGLIIGFLIEQVNDCF